MKNDFSDFLINEYNNIAAAHFRSKESIASFFRYYLIVMAIPITAFSVFEHLDESGKYVSCLGNDIILFLVSLIGLIGFFLFLYVINQKFTSILYARTVNGIRCYFYNDSSLSEENEAEIRVLPKRKDLPDYFEPTFLPVIAVYALINSFYLSVIVYSYSSLLCSTLFYFVIVIFHFLIYILKAYFREKEARR